MPSAPSVTASTSTGPGSDVNTTSDACATCCGVSPQFAPASRKGVAASRRMSCTVIVWPAACRCRVMCRPIAPSPMNPTSKSSSPEYPYPFALPRSRVRSP